jgi:uncharacterized membrane protein
MLAGVRRPTSATLLTTLLAGAGVMHFVVPGTYARIVPKSLGHAQELVYASGVAELAVAGAVAHPRTRATGGRLAALLFVAVFPANVSMALDSSLPPRLHRGALVRLPLQIPLVVWALRVGRAAQRSA